MPEKIDVQSAAPTKELSNEERRKRYAELRTRLGRSRLEVRGKPGMHYVWGPKDDVGELTRMDFLGYRIVHEKDPKHPEVQASGLREDGTYSQGDIILMEIPEETYQLIMEENDERSNAATFGASDAFRAEALKSGVPTFDVPVPKGSPAKG